MNANTSLSANTFSGSSSLLQGAAGYLFRLHQYLLLQQAEWCLHQTLRRERRALAGLPAHLLRDIGVTSDEAERESRCAGVPEARRKALLRL
ncbi:MAG: DUF1127 domain-containing protein [Thiothrix sp.]|nr:DUF1127 domain-containing protein [Thiothrix sp.]HPQ95505.1 DUF1127 domain-containing protein [Thiolinea sp.]